MPGMDAAGVLDQLGPDVDSGISMLFVYGSKGAKELYDAHVLPDGETELVGKGGTCGVRHAHVPIR